MRRDLNKKIVKSKSVADYFSLDLVEDPFIILLHDGVIYDINASCANLIGLGKEKIIGRSFRDFAPLNMLTEKITESLRDSTEDFDLIVYHEKHYEAFIIPFKTAPDLPLIRIILKDISNCVALERELLKRNKELMIVNMLSSAFIGSENLDLVIENLLKKVLVITDFKVGWLLLKEDGSFKLKTCREVSDEFKKAAEDGSLPAFCEKTIKTAEPWFVVMDSEEISRFPFLKREGIVSLAVVHLVSSGDIIGLLFLASKTGKERHFDIDFEAVLSLVGKHVSLIIDKIKLFQETRRLSLTDGLTGLYNSRYFYKQLDAEIARTNRYGGSFSLILLDIDDFKHLNDTYGHQAGDDVLCELANIFKSVSRETDVVVRYGGEEFVIILPSTSESDTVILAERIRSTVETICFLMGHTGGVKITVSGGIASYPQNAADARSLLNAADNALYAAKASGKNKVQYFGGK
jgi:diguanylate cyclase (GGDEF)-like protein